MSGTGRKQAFDYGGKGRPRKVIVHGSQTSRLDKWWDTQLFTGQIVQRLILVPHDLRGDAPVLVGIEPLRAIDR
jgi:hypothetical protein